MKRSTKTNVLASLNAIMFFISIIGLTNFSFSQNSDNPDNADRDLTSNNSNLELGYDHPENGLFTSHDPKSVELIQERTSHSKLFRNSDGTMSIRQSLDPMHYKSNGIWLTYDDQMNSDQYFFKLKSTDKQVKINKLTSESTLNFDDGAIKFGKNSSFAFVSSNGTIISDLNSNIETFTSDISNNSVVFDNIFTNNIDKKINISAGRVEFDYLINNSLSSPANTAYISFTDEFILPDGWVIEEGSGQQGTIGWNGSLSIKDLGKDEVGQIGNIVVYENSKSTSPIFGEYKIEKTGNNNKYIITQYIPSNWINSPSRIFPITVDPTVSGSNSSNCSNNRTSFLSTCGDQINVLLPLTATTIDGYTGSWNLNAINGAWKSEQNCRLNTNTTMTGSGNTAGIQAYSTPTYTDLNGPVPPGGSVAVKWQCYRTWGGSGCNTSYHTRSSFQVTVTYSTGGGGPVPSTCESIPYTQGFSSTATPSGMTLASSTYSSAAISSTAGNGSNGIMFTGGSSSSGWLSNSASGSYAMTFTTHVASATKCFDLSGSGPYTLSFDKKQLYTYNTPYTNFALYVNGTPIADMTGTTYYQGSSACGSWQTLSYDLSSYAGNSDVDIKWQASMKYSYSSAGCNADRVYIDNISLTATAPPVTPSISLSVNTTSTSVLRSCVGALSSGNKVLTVNGTNIPSSGILLGSTAGNKLVYSTSLNGTFTSTLTIPAPSSGTVSATIYVRSYPQIAYGTYETITASAGSASQALGSQYVYGYNPPTPYTTVSGPTTVCGDQAVTLTASGGTSGQYSSNGTEWGISSSCGSNTASGATTTSYTTPTITSATTFWVRKKGIGYCSTYTTPCTFKTVTHSPGAVSPTSITGIDGVCAPMNGTYTLTHNGGTGTIQWGTGSVAGSNIISSTSQTISVSPTGTTTYWTRRISTGGGLCGGQPSGAVYHTIYEYTDPVVSAGSSPDLCLGSTAQLTGTASGGTGASTEITVGATTSTYVNYYLMRHSYSDMKFQFIYSSGDMGGAGLLTSISFYVTQAAQIPLSNANLKLYNTTQANLQNGAITTGGSNVWSGTANPSSTGWYTINFDTPFNYTGGNLAVEFCYDNSTTNSSYPRFKAIGYRAYSCKYSYAYSTPGCNITPNSNYYYPPIAKFQKASPVGISSSTWTPSSSLTLCLRRQLLKRMGSKLKMKSQLVKLFGISL
jgi:hypothetical protein